MLLLLLSCYDPPYNLLQQNFSKGTKIHKDTVEGHIKHRLSFEPVLE